MQSQSIRIKQNSFDILAPYSAGDVLTTGEAQALNSLRAENIRNNATKEMGRRSSGGILTGVELEDFKSWLREYDAGYRFWPRGRQRVGGRPSGPIKSQAPFDRQLKAIAIEEARVRANSINREMTEVEIEILAGELLGDERLQAEAQRRVERSQEIAEAELRRMVG